MKKNIFLIILLFIVYGLFSETIKDQSEDLNNNLTDNKLRLDFAKMQNELTAMKKDIDMLKERTEWFTFKVTGSIKIIWGVNIWAKQGDLNKKIIDQNPKFNTSTPITHGFDFENRIRFSLNLGNKIIASSFDKENYGTEIGIDLKINSLGIDKIQPSGSYYVVAAKDDQNNPVNIYIPRYEAGSSNVIFGNFQIVLNEAIVKNIIGSGFFVNYKDIVEVDKYYGVKSLVEILKLNDEYFNNGFVEDNTDDFGSLYYSFNTRNLRYQGYEPESQVAEAVKLWSDSMLSTNSNDPNADTNQRPHGISVGYNKSLADGFHLYAEIGAASKDAFDPKYFTDNYIDYGFFLRFEPTFKNDKFSFSPKISLSYAFQTETTNDVSTEFSTFAAGVSLPFFIALPTGSNDKVQFELNWNLNVNIASKNLATMISFFPEFVLLNSKLTISLPLVYSFKNGNRGGFLRVGNEDIQWIDQLYDNHVFNLGFIVGFDSKKLFGSVFEYNVTNYLYFAYFKQWDSSLSYYANYQNFPDPETYFYEIFHNDFMLNDLGPERINMYVEFGVGYLRNAKIVDSTTVLKYIYNRNTDSWTDTTLNEMYWKRWSEATVLSIKTGIVIDIIRKFSVGLSAESPKILVNNSINPLGNQQSFGLFKLWSEIRF